LKTRDFTAVVAESLKFATAKYASDPIIAEVMSSAPVVPSPWCKTKPVEGTQRKRSELSFRVAPS
jgi:hypothetical protein